MKSLGVLRQDLPHSGNELFTELDLPNLPSEVIVLKARTLPKYICD